MTQNIHIITLLMHNLCGMSFLTWDYDNDIRHSHTTRQALKTRQPKKKIYTFQDKIVSNDERIRLVINNLLYL